MLGAIIGDIAGSRYEFNPTNNYDFKMFAKDSDFTDDTICTVAVADAIMNSKDYGKCIHEWCRKYPNPMGGYGGRFAAWVHNRNPQPYNSFGNGSAMRVSPVAWLFDDLQKVLSEAKKTSDCTHSHPEGVKGAQTVAMAIYEARNGKNVKDVLTDCVKFSKYDINIRKIDAENRFDETCMGTVPVALWIIGQATDFEDAVRKAVSLGADADTLGAIVGSIAEAVWGIPREIKKKALGYLPQDMIKVIEEFYNRV